MTQVKSVTHGPVRPELVRDETLASLFAAAVKLHGHRVALSDDSGTVTYAELDALTDRIAAALQKSGAVAGRFVGLWMPRGRDVLIAQLAIAKTGAAWLPFDADAPVERVLSGVDDLEAVGVVIPDAWRARLTGRAAALPFERLMIAPPVADPLVSTATADDTAYAIYTSGSTGKPKGIPITNSNICHFLRAAALRYGLGADDVMLQCSSVAFDLSLEEIWLPYHVGARLEICPPDVLVDPERLSARIRDAHVTALDVVPTLLALLPELAPSVRLIIAGGEAFPDALLSRLARPGLTIVNSYGPSEATVVATAADLAPGQRITIGRPLANMTAYVVDEQLNLVDREVEGELLIGGPGIAKGYIDRAALTAQKFIANPFADGADDPVLYRSGDAVIMTAAGDIVFRGRVDDQVKLRGFRIELGEIEALLAAQPDIAAAAVVVNAQHGYDQLVGFVVPRGDRQPDVTALKAALRTQLPAYMVPTVVQAIDALPVLAASGKIDRKALATHPLPAASAAQGADENFTETEGKLVHLVKALLPGQSVLLDADFFLDLGGHSLLAAQFVSAARRDPALAHMTLGQLYDGRSLRQTAKLIDADRPSARREASAPPLLLLDPDVLRRRFWCGLAQLAALPFLATMLSAPWLAIFIGYTLLAGDDAPWWVDLGYVALGYAGTLVALALLALAAKWLILGRTRAGRYPLWGLYYYRVWLVQRMIALVHLKWMQNSPVIRGYLRALGAKIGKDALISDFDAGAIDLLEIGAHTTTGSKTVFANARIEGAELVIGRICIGRDVAIGSTCAIEGDVEIGDGAEIGDLTALVAGTRVAAGEHWDGAAGVYIGQVDAELPEPPPENWWTHKLRAAGFFLAFGFAPAIAILPIVPAFHLMEWLDTMMPPALRVNYFWYLPVLALSVGLALPVLSMLMIVGLRWLILPQVRPGTYPVTGFFYWRRWFVSLLIEAALDTLSSLFATVYMGIWYRLMGAKIGRGTEISTSFAGRYELITLGAGNFIADDVIMNDDELRRNWLTLGTVQTGDHVFIGNDAVIAQGARIGDRALIGVKSKLPKAHIVGNDEIWLGSPSIELPTRQRFASDERHTFAPPLTMRIGRAVYEAFNIALPTALFVALVTMVMEALAPVFDRQHWVSVALICVIASSAIALVQLFVAAGYKWILMGRYKPVVKPMWSWWALKTEATSVMYWGMAGRALLDQLRGTPFLSIALRLFGVKTGRGVYMDYADITEFDCVTIGDGAIINNHAILQTHLYEDRLMKIGRIHIAAGATIGTNATVLYDTEIGANANIGPLTLVMKGEFIPANSAFWGAPARPAEPR